MCEKAATKGKKKFDSGRLARMTAFGMFCNGPWAHYWYHYLDKVRGPWLWRLLCVRWCVLLLRFVSVVTLGLLGSRHNFFNLNYNLLYACRLVCYLLVLHLRAVMISFAEY